MVKNRIDKFYFFLVSLLLTSGFIIFLSAAQSLLSRENAANFWLVAGKQLAVLLIGVVAMILTSHLSYKYYRRFAFWIFLVAIGLSLLVFVPVIGHGSGGANRWIDFGGPFTFQPSELLKFGFVVYAAYWLSSEKDKILTLRKGVVPFLIILAIPALILLKEPDTGSFMVLFAAACAMLLGSGARWKHLGLILLAAIILVAGLAWWKPYIRDRLTTFLDPSQDVLGASYQINQSLIAIGSGGVMGRGFGQSIQKFNYLPEAIGDSIFAVLAEEFGLIGSSLILILYAIFTIWGLKIAARVNDSFGRLLALGLVILISAQAFINISAMVGLIPLTGVPLTFISHGGSALIIALMEVGIILNISRHRTV